MTNVVVSALCSLSKRYLIMEGAAAGRLKHQGPVSQKILSPLVILRMEKTMVTKVIGELKSVSRLKILPETDSRGPILENLHSLLL